MNKIITRFAPSPTGLFHIGSARTALFNYLFAKKLGGKFIVRVEDTDPVRSKKEYEEDILDGLEWLGLNHDGKVTYQSKRKEIYQKYIEQLLKKELAYKKDGAIWFDIAKSQKLIANSLSIRYDDLILGEIEFDIDQFHDFVLIKSDGMPLYMFAATIDDHEMGVTHVIRGADHVNSTPQQIMLYQALGFDVPKFGHMPLILNTDKSKMSKRKNPVSVTCDFRDQGYLPEAMINYLALLGWSPKDNREFFTLDELKQAFDIKKVNKSPAVFDIEKLNYFNNHYIKTLPIEKLLKLISNFQFLPTPFMVGIPIPKGIGTISNKIPNLKSQNDKEKLEKILEIIKPRMQKLSEFNELSSFFFKLPEYKTELLIFKKSTKEKTKQGLLAINSQLSVLQNSDLEQNNKIDNILSKIVSNNKLTNGDVFWPIRVALSGLDKSPSPTEMLWVLGKDESTKRIKQAIDKLK